MMKVGLEQIDVYVYNAVRLTISALVLVIFALFERRRGVLPLPGIRRRQIIVYALMVCALYQLLFLLGIAKTTSGNTALIIATVPMWTALLARFALGETLRVIAWCGLVVALICTVIVAMQKGDVTTAKEHLIGNLIILTAALVWAIGTVYSRPLLKKISPLQLAATASMIALPIHILFGVRQFSANLQALKSFDLWLILLYSGVLSSGLAQPMWHFGVRRAGAAHAAIIQNLIPLVAIVAAWLSRGESATTPQIFGGTLILAGLVTMRAGRNNGKQDASNRCEQEVSQQESISVVKREANGEKLITR